MKLKVMALTLLLGASAAQAQELVLSNTLEIGAQFGPSSFNSIPVSFASNSTGHYFVAQEMSGENVMVFDSTGRFLRWVGREGRGPGEYIRVTQVFVNHRDDLFVFDQGQSRILIFDSAGVFVDSYNVPAVRGELSYVNDSTFILNQEIHSPEAVGLPLHLLQLRKPVGEITKSFAAARALYVYNGDSVEWIRQVNRYVTDGTVWAARYHEYRIDRIDIASGDTLQTIRRDVDWFKPRAPVVQFSADTPPPAFIRDIKVDGDEIWVLIIVPDPDWRSVVKGWTIETAPTIEIRLAEYHDTRIEVLDNKTGELVASRTIDEFGMSFLGARQVAFVYDDEYLIGYLKIVDVTLER